MESISGNFSYTIQLQLYFTEWGTVFYLVVHTPVVLAAIFGNLLVIFAYFSERKLWKPGNTLIMSLAITDLLTGVTFPLYAVNRLLLSNVTCQYAYRFLLFFPFPTMTGSSLIHLMLIGLDRAISLVKPLQYPSIVTNRRCKMTLVISWLCLIAISVPFITWHLYPKNNEWVCDNAFNFQGVYAYFALIVTIFILSMFSFMFVSYFIVIKIVLKHIKQQNLRTTEQGRLGKRPRSQHLEAAVTMAIVMGAFVICSTPAMIKVLLEVYGSYSIKTLDIIQVTTELLNLSNSTLNPIIYGYRNKSFRAAYNRVIWKYCSGILRKNTSNLQCNAHVITISKIDDDKLSKISTSAT